MPICYVDCNENVTIIKITGSDKMKKHLYNLGFTVGETVQVVNKVNDSIILKIKGVTLAISEELARRILI